MPNTLTTNPQNNTARMVHVDPSNGSTITRASLKALSIASFEAMDNEEVKMEREIDRLEEARIAGARESSLHDLLTSRTAPVRMVKLGDQGSIIAPFSYVPRRHNINVNFFKVTAGELAAPTGVTIDGNNVFAPSGTPTTLAMSASATTGAGATVPHDGTDTMAWVLTVTLGDEVGTGLAQTNFNKSALKNIGSFFLPGSSICVETNGANIANSGSSGDAEYSAATPYTFVFQIVGAYSHGTDGTAKVVVIPSYPAATFSGFSTAQREQVAGRPVAGAAVLMQNSVSDYESYNEQGPAINNKEMLVYWNQTSRSVHQYNEEYLKALDPQLGSTAWKSFRQLPIVEQKRQQFRMEEKKWFNTVFFGQPKDTTNQTTANYENLEAVTDPLDSAMTLEYKSQTLGIYTQLSDAGRIHNFANAAMNIDVIFEILYNLKRNREADGGTVDVIDCMTDRKTASRIHQAMLRYYKAYYASDFAAPLKTDQKVVFEGRNLWSYNLYDIPESNVQWAVIVEPYFNDRTDAFVLPSATNAQATLATRANSLWFLDWSDIEIGMLKNRSVERKTNEMDDQFNFIIQPNIRHILLESKTYQVRVYDPNRHAILQNFTTGAPVISTLVGSVL
jgi:hypothetical protein